MLLAAVIAFTAACDRGGESDSSLPDDVNIEVEVTPDPPEVGPAIIQVFLSDDAGSPIDGATLEVEGTMSHAGMEPVVVSATGEVSGLYRSDGFSFTMGGDWIITVSGSLPDGREIEHTFDLRGVSG